MFNHLGVIMTEFVTSRIEWPTYETKAASLHQERRSEELQLERLRLRLQDMMQDVEARENALTAA